MLKECVKVVNGGSLDIDHRVTNPLGVVVERGLRKKEGAYEASDPAVGLWQVRLMHACNNWRP